MKERILKFLDYLEIGQTKFEQNTGLARGLINNIKNDISLKSIRKIADAYPELNINWLQTGEGDMLMQGSISQRGKNNIVSNIKNNRNIGENSGNQGTINYNLMSKDEFAQMMEKRFNHMLEKEQQLIQKDSLILEKDNRLYSIFEENRALTEEIIRQNQEQRNYNAAYQKQADRIAELTCELKKVTDKLVGLLEKTTG